MDRSIENILKDAGLEITPELLLILSEEVEEKSIPVKVEHNMFNYFPVKDLKAIHPNRSSARELVLILLSNLSSTYIRSKNYSNERERLGYKRLHSTILQRQTQYSLDGKTYKPYKRIIEYLIKNNVIEMGRKGRKGEEATEYRLTDTYRNKGMVKYRFKTDLARKLLRRAFNENLERVVKTNIGKNSLVLRSQIQFPTEEEVDAHLDKKIAEGYVNKKGKRLIKLGKHSKKEYPEEEFIYKEEYLDRFIYLRDQLKVPFVDPDKMTDSRIVDGFNLMPTVIRELFLLNGKEMVETDYSALHPNIVQRYYGGSNKEGITHDKVAKELGMTRKEVKKMHLTFFNMEIPHLLNSPLYEYYDNKEPLMIERIIEEKRTSERGHRATADTLFMVETNMMEDVIGECMELGLKAMYVFDAIYSTKEDQADIQRVMQRIANKYKVKTKAIAN